VPDDGDGSAGGAEARDLALGALDAVLGGAAALEDALAEDPRFATLAERDRAFARRLAATTLRRLGQIDAVVASFLRKPLPAELLTGRNLIRLGAAQLLFLGTPPYAAVDRSVVVARRRGLEALSGLVNAVLRRVAREGPALVAAQDAARLDTPGWLWDSWLRAYGEERTRAIAAVHLAEPPLDIMVKGGGDVWARRLDAEILPNGALRRPFDGPVSELPGYREGAWWVQDAAAALPASLLLRHARPGGDDEVVDLCAAPGGKTAQLAAAGARVVAVERSPARAARLRENLARLRLPARVEVADALDWRPDRPARLVLLDAPCTATGTARRHPDVLHNKRPRDVARLARLQSRLLMAAADMLAPGGTLVYCACSLQPEEGAARIDALLAAGGAPLRREPIAAGELLDMAEITSAGDAMTLPCHLTERGGLDGFFIARLRRLS
jgi:16S rRNA (cytosine967-C5)-methyltransferase